MSDKLELLRAKLTEIGPVVVAFSGGVDSSFLLRIAADVLGDKAVALTTRSPTEISEDYETAERLARQFGVEHVVVDADELEIPGYAANPTNRCFFCKDSLYKICLEEAGRRNIATVVDGVNADDLGDYRPGLGAADQHGIRHPLVEVGLTKQEIRGYSQALGLPTWDKPSSPCLSSRFPYGTTITRTGLDQVARAERVLRQLGFRECRVRFHDKIARIEVPADQLARLVEPAVRAEVAGQLRQLGFHYITVDLQGFRSGSLNEVLK